MVESLKELNQICQKPRYKEDGNWMVRNILREAALPVTWLLLHTRVTANQVTTASLVIGLLGIMLFVFQSPFLFLLGTLLLQFWYLLDHVDGQIARYRKTACLSGRFFDFVTHHLIHGVIFFSLGFYVYQVTGRVVFVVWGFAASIATMMFNLAHDTKYKTFFEKIMKEKPLKVNALEEEVTEEKITGNGGPLKKLFSLIHKLSEIHVLMNILTGAAFLQLFVHTSFDFRICLFIFYGLAVPALAIVKISYLISKRKIDEEYNACFSQPDEN